TAVGGNADTLRLYNSTGGVASPVLTPPTSTYLEPLYSPNEAAVRSIAAFNVVGSSNSAVLTTATFANAPVSAASTFTLVGITSAAAAWGTGGNTSGTEYTALLSTRTPLTLTDTGLLAVTTAPSGSPSAPFSNLTPDTSYYLFVRAVGRTGAPSGYSALGSTVTGVNEPVTAASTFSAVAITSMTASWSTNGNLAGTRYEAILSTTTPLIGTHAGNIVLSTRPEGGPSGLFGGLTPDTSYYLFVRAVGRSGNPTPYTSLGSTVTAVSEPGSAASTFSAVAITSMTASWNANGNPAGTLYEAILSTATPLITTHAGNIALSTRPEGGPSGLFMGLSADTTYHLFARAFGPAGSPTGFSALGSTASLADKPSASSVTAVSSSALSLAWSGGSNPSDTLYEVSYSSVDAFASGAAISTGARASGTTASLGGLSASTTYYLRVRAINRRGLPTEFDAAVSTLTAPPLPAVPGTPVGAALGISSISWTWTASTYSLSYEVYSASSGALLASPASTSFAQTGLSTNTAYGIRTRGINATGASPLSAAATTYSAAAQPGQPSVSGRTSNSLSLSWDASGNPSGTRYEISLSTDDFALNFSTPVPLSSGLTASATTFGGLQLGATYYSRVRAFNGDSSPSGFSSRVSTLTLNFPDPPSGLAAAALSSTTLLWTWTDASSDEAGFRVYSATAGKVSPDLAANTTFWLQTGLSADASAQNRVVSFAASSKSFLRNAT
ncbi:MAG: fibronectin type III domain-containing protein, partial [Elusimicrobiota bacterium]